MLTFTEIPSADKAKKYYIHRKSLEAYYCDNQEFNGYWGGKGAELLGLKNYLADDEFCRLVENLHPGTGEQMTPRMRSDRRPGFDLTFSAPKSVSLAYAFSKDDRIVQAFRRAVWDTRDEMELEAATRVRSGMEKDADENRTTGNWVAAEFVHLTARPVDGWPDPLIHVHLVVMNMTHDPVEAKWKALQMGDIRKETPYYEGAFHRRLKANLEAIGLEIVGTENGFEIAGVSRETVEKFSRRTGVIEETAERLGITDPEQKAKLGTMTREKKNKSLLMSDLVPIWEKQLTDAEEEVFEGLKTRLQRSRAAELSREMTAGEPEPAGQSSDALGTQERLSQQAEAERSSESLGKKKRLREGEPERRQSMNQRTRPGPGETRVSPPTEYDYQAVALAIEHTFERQSVVSEKQLMAEAFNNWRIHKATYDGVRQVVAEAPLLRQVLNGRMMVTTPEVLAEEKRLTALCQRGKDKFEPINRHWQIYDEQLNEGQRGAVFHALNSRDFITGIAGVAGSGKTTVMREIDRAAKEGFYEPVVLSPLAATAHETLREDGFENAETIAKFLNSTELQKQVRGGLILVDEAGLISNRLADEFLHVAESVGARVILVGDAGQLHSVERGQAFDHLRRNGEMKVAEVTEILRQKEGPYRQFVEMYVEGNTRRAVTSLWSMGAMVEQPLEELKHTVAKDYVDALEKGKSCLAVSPTHAEIDCLTDALRDELKQRKRLGPGVEWDVLKNQSWSDAQKGDYEHYKDKKGLIVQFNRHVKGFALGERVEVIDVRDNVVRVRAERPYHSEIKKLPLQEADKFSVYEWDKIEVCEGDMVEITGNGRDANGRRVNNGTWKAVDYISHDGKLVLENGLQIDKGFPHLTHGWVLTAYAAQGKTVDCVFACQTQELSDPATNQDQFHVATTRGREGLKNYTDNFEWLKDRVSERPDRMMATELLDHKTGKVHGSEPEPLSARLGRTGTPNRKRKAEREKVRNPEPERKMEMVMQMGM